MTRHAHQTHHLTPVSLREPHRHHALRAPPWLTARPFAHRGLHGPASGLVENTLSAARAAVEAGFGIECDVQITADGEAVVFHDDRLERLTTAQGDIRDYTVAALAGIRYRGGGASERIVTLAEFLGVIGPGVPVLVEIKSRFDGDLALLHRVAEVLAAAPPQIAVMSFDDEVVAEARRLVPERPRGLVAEASYDDVEWSELTPERKARLATLRHLDASQPDFIAWSVADLPSPMIRMARYLGLAVLSWTVRSEEERKRASLEADQIIFEAPKT